jgi:ABC-type branched-subunit amino acid transport system substrate-binding protein
MSFYDILIEGMKKNLQADESIEIIEDLLPTDIDFKRVVTKSKKMNFDTLGMFLSPTQILSFLKEAKIQKFNASFFGASPFQSHTLIKQANGMMDNSIFFHNDVSQEFETKYIERFKNDIQIPWAANAYDFVTLSSELFNNLESKPTTERILELFSQDRIHNGAGGAYHYVNSPTEGKYFEYPIVVKKIIGQNFQEVFRNTKFGE